MMKRSRFLLVLLGALAVLGLVSTVVMLAVNFGDPTVEAGQQIAALLGPDGSMSIVVNDCPPLKNIELRVSELPATTATDLAGVSQLRQGTVSSGSLFHTPPGVVDSQAARLLVIVIGVRAGTTVQYQLVAERSDLSRFGAQPGRALRSGEFSQLSASHCVGSAASTAP